MATLLFPISWAATPALWPTAHPVELYDNLASFPATWVADTLYVDKDTWSTYVWDGSNYIVSDTLWEVQTWLLWLVNTWYNSDNNNQQMASYSQLWITGNFTNNLDRDVTVEITFSWLLRASWFNVDVNANVICDFRWNIDWTSVVSGKYTSASIWWYIPSTSWIDLIYRWVANKTTVSVTHVVAAWDTISITWDYQMNMYTSTPTSNNSMDASWYYTLRVFD